MRIRYLNEQIHEALSLSKHPINMLWCNEMMEEIHFITVKMQKAVYKNGNKDNIDDADIAMARSVRVDTLIDFKNGVAPAWCHEDKRPSLFFASRLGIAICPACGNKTFNAVDVLMDRDGMTFIEAVKSLR